MENQAPEQEEIDEQQIRQLFEAAISAVTGKSGIERWTEEEQKQFEEIQDTLETSEEMKINPIRAGLYKDLSIELMWQGYVIGLLDGIAISNNNREVGKVNPIEPTEEKPPCL